MFIISLSFRCLIWPSCRTVSCCLRLLLHSSQIALRDFHRLLILPFGAELDDFAVFLKEGKMPWRHVVHVARTEELVMVGVPDPNATLQDVAPMGTLAAIIR